jgi:hypothetical protein
MAGSNKANKPKTKKTLSSDEFAQALTEPWRDIFTKEYSELVEKHRADWKKIENLELRCIAYKERIDQLTAEILRLRDGSN